jgi:putative ABC transport system permease protein
MLRNYFLIALRSISRQKVYSAINIFGLTLGITSTLLLVLYIADELSYDRFHPDAGRIYRTVMSANLNGQAFNTTSTGLPMAEALMNDVPEVQEVIRITRWNTMPVRFEDKRFTESRFVLADSNFFSFFNGYRLLTGNPNDALKGPNKVVISERAARKYFGYTGSGDRTPIGKVFQFGSDGFLQAEVTGIAEDPPHNAHLQYDFILSIQSWDMFRYPQFWLNSAVVTYFKLHPQSNVSSMDAKYEYFVKTYIAREVEQFLNMSMDQLFNSGSYVRFSTQALTDIHLHSQLPDELEPNGNIRYLYLFGMIAVFLIVLACINFMNLSTARAANRAKEVGIRKTVGALRSKLIGQFMMESYLYTIVAVVFALMLVSMSLNLFNLITAKNMVFSSLFNPVFVVGLVLFTLLVGALAGSYPAFYLTSFMPAEVLKGKVRAGMKRSGIRNALVVFQFFISIGLIIASLVVFQQLKYVQNQNLGFDKDNIMTLMHTMALGKNADAFRNELLQRAEVEGVTFVNRMPPNIDWSATFRMKDTGNEQLLMVYVTDYDALETMGYQLVAGRFFSRDFPSDSTGVLLNEAAMRHMGWDSHEGKKLISRYGSFEEYDVDVLGVLGDFNFESLKNNIRPMIVLLQPGANFEAGIRFTAADIQKNIELVENVWKKYAPDAPFEYSFLDTNFAAKYKAEERLGQVFIIFTTLAIIIACLGLLGLATYSAEQRAKELSIRKAMGATISQLVLLLSKDFARLVLIAFILAIPLTWYLLEKLWLESFAYRVGFDAGVMLLAGALALLIALVTISVKAWQAAISNPVDALKND